MLLIVRPWPCGTRVPAAARVRVRAGLSYYICDDCCKGFDFLWQLAWVYDAIKRIDPCAQDAAVPQR